MSRAYSEGNEEDAEIFARRNCESFQIVSCFSVLFLTEILLLGRHFFFLQMYQDKIKFARHTSVTTVQWSRRSGFGIKFLTLGGASGDFRGGFAVKYERTSILVRVAVCVSMI